MNLFNLYSGAVICIETRNGRKRVWVHVGKARYPLINWADLEEEMAREAPNWDLGTFAPPQRKAQG